MNGICMACWLRRGGLIREGRGRDISTTITIIREGETSFSKLTVY